MSLPKPIQIKNRQRSKTNAFAEPLERRVLLVLAFTPVTLAPMVGRDPRSVAATEFVSNSEPAAPLDLNGDGKVDLVAANRGDNTLSVLLGNGDGTFASQQTFVVG